MPKHTFDDQSYTQHIQQNSERIEEALHQGKIVLRGGYHNIKGRGGYCASWGVKKASLAPLRVFSLERSTAEALSIPFTVNFKG